MTDALTLFSNAAQLAASAANDVTLTLKPDGVDIRAQGRRDVLWPGLPAASLTIPWDQLAEQTASLAEAIHTLDALITKLRSERLQKELG